MITRRTFLQLAALAAAGAPALASSEGSLQAVVTTRLEGTTLVAELTLRNAGSSEIHVLLERGNESGVSLTGTLESHPLFPALIAKGPPEAMTRAGPRRVFFPLPPGGTLNAGAFRFLVPKAVKLPALASFTVVVTTDAGVRHLSTDGTVGGLDGE